MSASIPQIVGKQVRVVYIKALPDEIFGLIKQWLLPVKPKKCAACNTPCVKPHLMKNLDTTHSLIKRANYCNTCWCSKLKCPSFDKIKDHFTDELTKHLYPTDTVIKSELKRRSNKIAGEWRLITKGKWLFDTHKLRKTQEKTVFYKRLLNKGILLHVSEMVRKVNITKDLANAQMRKEILRKALAKRFSESRVSYKYFAAVLHEISCHLYGESEMTAILAKWTQIDNIKQLTHIRSTHGANRWMTDKDFVLMFDLNVCIKNKRFEFCGYWNSITHKIEYKC